jgi:hypothetical protein
MVPPTCPPATSINQQLADYLRLGQRSLGLRPVRGRVTKILHVDLS